MGSIAGTTEYKGHAVCIPWPAQGHINPMLSLAKLLHHKGFYITFVNTEYSHRRLLKSGGPSALDGLPDFRFTTIPDGLPPSNDIDAAQDLPSLCVSTTTTCLEPFCELLEKLNSSAGPEVPPVSCIVSDGVMSFTLEASERFGLPEVLFWTLGACAFFGTTQLRQLIEKGYTPIIDTNQVTNDYLETTIDWIPGIKNIQLKDFPFFTRTIDPKDILLNFLIQEAEAAPRATAVILNTFDALEQDVLNALSSRCPQIYTLGPLHLMTNHLGEERLDAIRSSLWKEDSDYIKWLDSMPPGSVVYVNFGSSTMITAQQLTEFAWGLANSVKPFLWIIRPDMVAGYSAVLPQEFVDETKDRSMISGWCPQEQVLNHPAVGVFLTHSGWNSTVESISSGVPVICWPFFADQQTNCHYCRVEWGIGMEIDNNVKRDEVEMQIRELMDGVKGKKVKEKATQWKIKAQEATQLGGSSYLNLDKLIKEVLHPFDTNNL